MNGFLQKKRAAFRSPEKVAQDIYDIQTYLKAPTFVVGDIRQGGKDYVERLMAEAKKLGVDNRLVLELFAPANQEFFSLISRSVPSYSIDFSRFP